MNYTLKPDMNETHDRWNAYWQGNLVGRPIVCVTSPIPGKPAPQATTYYDRVFGDLDQITDRMLQGAECTFWGGDAVPNVKCSFGPDETAAWCGAELKWSGPHAGDTNWSEPIITDWNQSLPIRLNIHSQLWKRMLQLQQMLHQKGKGRIAASSWDTHTNMDLLAALRGPQDLCMDLVDCPQVIDRAMDSARKVFPDVWQALRSAGGWDTMGYWNAAYCATGMACLQCDFSCMISTEMFRRWVMPALEEEAAIVGRTYYHWDGPDAIKHLDALCSSRGLHTMSYVPGVGHGTHLNHIQLFQKVQSYGKSVHFWGSPDECLKAHRQLKPNLTMYSTWTSTPDEARAIVDQFSRHT